MRNRLGLGLMGTLIALAFTTTIQARPQETTSTTTAIWDTVQLKKAVEDIGYETKVLNATAGKEKYEFVVERGGLKIPIATEISGSKNYVWLTVRLGDAPKNFAEKGEKLGALLKTNFKIQPCQFYITDSGALMIALAVENRALTNPVLRRRVDFLVNMVVDHKDTWQTL